MPIHKKTYDPNENKNSFERDIQRWMYIAMNRKINEGMALKNLIKILYQQI